MKTVTWYVPKGMEIGAACRMATRKAQRNKCRVKFTFNDTKLTATPKKPARVLWLEWCAIGFMILQRQ